MAKLAASSRVTSSTGEIQSHVGDAVLSLYRRLRQRILPVDEREGFKCHCHLAGAQKGRVVRKPLLYADSSDVYPGFGRLPIETHAHVRVAPQ